MYRLFRHAQALGHVGEAVALGRRWGSNAQIWRHTSARVAPDIEVSITWDPEMTQMDGLEWNNSWKILSNWPPFQETFKELEHSERSAATLKLMLKYYNGLQRVYRTFQFWMATQSYTRNPEV